MLIKTRGQWPYRSARNINVTQPKYHFFDVPKDLGKFDQFNFVRCTKFRLCPHNLKLANASLY